MKTELQIQKALNHLEHSKETDQEGDIETINDVDKVIDVLRWVLELPDEDGLDAAFGKFLDAL